MDVRPAQQALAKACLDISRAGFDAMKVLIVQECVTTANLLLAKNAAYGDSASDPLYIFSDASPIERMDSRIDDKLKRYVNVRRGALTDREDTELDLIGYLIVRRALRRALEGAKRQ